MNEVGELVRSYRKCGGLTQEGLAEKVGRSIATISRIENDAPVGPYSLEIVLRELGIPVFCCVYSTEYSKLIEIKRELLTAIYCEDIEWYVISYKEYLNCRELDGVMGEKYFDYFKAMYIFLSKGGEDILYKRLVETFDKSASIKEFVDIVEKNGQDLFSYRINIRRIIRENESEIDILLINGIAVSLFFRGKYTRAEIVFEELIYQIKKREGIFEAKHSNIPTICYNLSLCYSMKGKYIKAREILEFAKSFYAFRDNLRLEIKYEKMKKELELVEKNIEKFIPIFSFPKPIYWYTLPAEINNLRKWK